MRKRAQFPFARNFARIRETTPKSSCLEVRFCTQVRFRRYAGEEERNSSRCARLIGLLETPDPPIRAAADHADAERLLCHKISRKICKARPLGAASTKQMFAPPFFLRVSCRLPRKSTAKVDGEASQNRCAGTSLLLPIPARIEQIGAQRFQKRCDMIRTSLD